MKIKSVHLLTELTNLIQQHLTRVQKLQSLSNDQLVQKTTPESWNALECIEHLNRYGNFYLPEIKRRIDENKVPSSHEFKSGWLGNYFAKTMWPKEKLNKMKTFTAMNPANTNTTREVLAIFIEQLQTMLQLLQKAANIDLNKTKTSISISRLIKLKLGDTLRVVIYHNERHIRQAEKASQAF